MEGGFKGISKLIKFLVNTSRLYNVISFDQLSDLGLWSILATFSTCFLEFYVESKSNKLWCCGTAPCQWVIFWHRPASKAGREGDFEWLGPLNPQIILINITKSPWVSEWTIGFFICLQHYVFIKLKNTHINTNDIMRVMKKGPLFLSYAYIFSIVSDQ